MRRTEAEGQKRKLRVLTFLLVFDNINVMIAQHITLDIPYGLMQMAAKAEIEKEFRRFLALKYYQEETVTIGQAAQLAGMSRPEFDIYLARNHIPISLLDYEDIQADLGKMEDITSATV
jgi:predicted HTH domain antitoxin